MKTPAIAVSLFRRTRLILINRYLWIYPWFLCLVFAKPQAMAEAPCDFLNSVHLPRRSQQVILVVARDWDSSQGSLQLFSRQGKHWMTDGGVVPVTVGRKGMGWGLGRFRLTEPTGLVKIEGDSRSPAGIFELAEGFGYSETPPTGCQLPYRAVTERDYFVDDPQSSEYNSWVRLPLNANFPEMHWRSFERMRRDDGNYEFGIIVRHNMNPVVQGRGSAIFLHVWSGPDRATAGCTATSQVNLLRLLAWLDPSKQPLFIQVPEIAMRSRAGLIFK